ncbi:MAG: dihydrolipoyl dehydrogenase [Deltaproteobacteria bacterium]|nr:dihydrolipoyl dehydrogenase [Deltaproteobacteria bacterium]
MAETLETRAVVIGAGPAGYVAAIRLGQLGLEPVLVEKGELGGTCLNVGCIPSKALISASKLVHQLGHSSEMGISCPDVKVDLAQMMRWKDGIVGRLTGGVGQLVKGHGGRVVQGAASFEDAHTLRIDGPEGERRLRFEHAIVATGSAPASLPGFEFDGRSVVGSTEALAWTTAPERLLVIGGGYIGMELGGVWQRLGSRVTVVEFEDRVLPGFDKDLARPVVKRFQAQGGTLLTGTKARGFRALKGGGVEVEVESRKDGTRRALEADVILLTVGRRPLSGGLGLEKAGVALDARGFIVVDGAQRTNVSHIFAVGDVAGEPMLAHKGSKEGEVAAEVIAGRPSAFDTSAVPAVVFTDPEIATVGMTEGEAKAAGYEPRAARFGFAGNGRALSLNDAEGFVRLVACAETGRLLGAQIVGPEASNLIAELGLALEMGALVSDIGLTIHAHPTLAEAVMEAANAVSGHAIHAPPSRR